MATKSEVGKLGTLGKAGVPGFGRHHNPISAPGMDLRTPDDRNVDDMAEAAARFGKMWAEYFDQHNARYQIEWGVVPEGDVEISDDTGTYTTRLPMRFEVVMMNCFDGEKPDEEEMNTAGDRFLEQSGLGEFLYYDGWESGSCDSNDPHDWPKNFWYEHDRTGELYTYESFETHVRKPQIRGGVSTKKLKSKLLR